MGWIKFAVSRRRLRGIATRVRGKRASRNVELRQTVECLGLNSILRPVFAQRPEVVIEGAVFLCQENNVIDGLQAGRI